MKGYFGAIQEISQLWFEVFSAVGKYPFQYVSPSTIGCRFLVTYSWQFLLLKEVLWQKNFFFLFLQLLNQGIVIHYYNKDTLKCMLLMLFTDIIENVRKLKIKYL